MTSTWTPQRARTASTKAVRFAATRIPAVPTATTYETPAPMERTIDAVCEMAREARRAGASYVVAVGTAGLRVAANRTASTKAVRARCGVQVEVISGGEESRLGYVAATAAGARGTGSIAVVETGGGSTQFTFGEGGRIRERFSLDVGAVRLTEDHHLDGPVSGEALGEAFAAAGAELAPLSGRARPDLLIGIGGAFTNLAAVRHELAAYDPGVIEGTVLDKLGRDSIVVSDRGLRHALVAERFEGGA